MKKSIFLWTLGALLLSPYLGANGAGEAAGEETPRVVRFAHSDNNGREYYEVLAEEFEAANPEVTVEIEVTPTATSDEYMRKMDLLLLSGDAADVVTQKSLVDHAVRAEQGLFLPLNDLMKAEGIDINETYSIDTTMKDGMVYGLPEGVVWSFVYLNKDALDAAGLPLPDADWTWEDFRRYARELTSGSGPEKVYGSFMPTWGDPVHSYIVMNITKEDNPLFYDENTHALGDQKIADWLRYRYSLENEDKTQVPYYEVKGMKISYRDYFFAEKCLMLPAFGPWIFKSIGNSERYPHDFVTAVAPLPAWKDGPRNWTRAGADILAVNNKSKNPVDAYNFIRMLTTHIGPGRRGYPALKELDTDKLVELYTRDNPGLYDIESMRRLFGSGVYMNVTRTIPPENGEIRNLFMEEQETYLMGGRSLEETVKVMVERADEVMKR